MSGLDFSLFSFSPIYPRGRPRFILSALNSIEEQTNQKINAMNSTITKQTVPDRNVALNLSAKWFLILAVGLGCSVIAIRMARANPPDTIHYPDLQTLPPYDITIQNDPVTHHKLLRFSNAIANLGEGPMELVPQNNAVTGTTDAYQRLYSHDANGNWYVADTVYVGTFVFHPQHNHWHFEDFARYELRNVATGGSIGDTVLASASKVSFCLEDSIVVNSGLEHFSSSQTYTNCDQVDPQGISIGWADVYGWNLFGQSLDITRIPNGVYWLVSTADPDNLVSEGGGATEANNTAAVKIRIKGGKVSVVR